MIEIDYEQIEQGAFHCIWMQPSIPFKNGNEITEQLYAQMMGWA